MILRPWRCPIHFVVSGDAWWADEVTLFQINFPPSTPTWHRTVQWSSPTPNMIPIVKGRRYQGSGEASGYAFDWLSNPTRMFVTIGQNWPHVLTGVEGSTAAEWIEVDERLEGCSEAFYAFLQDWPVDETRKYINPLVGAARQFLQIYSGITKVTPSQILSVMCLASRRAPLEGSFT